MSETEAVKEIEDKEGGEPIQLEDMEKLPEPTGKWIEYSEGNLVSVRNVKDIIEPGYYDVSHTDMLSRRSAIFQNIAIKSECLIEFEDTASVKVLEEIKTFWSMEDQFKKFGMPYKRGILLYGPPGSGKTCLLKLLIMDVIKRGGACLRMETPSDIVLGMRDLRASQPGIPIVVIMEDIDEILEQNNQSYILNILDGVEDTHKVLFLATTNYPAKLQKRISDRPSRFDRRVRIPNPNQRCRKIYFQHLFNGLLEDSKVDIDQWAKDTRNMSLAHLKELFVSVHILGNKYDTVLENLKNMKKKTKKDADGEGGMGF